jgi:hypothetical protein
MGIREHDDVAIPTGCFGWANPGPDGSCEEFRRMGPYVQTHTLPLALMVVLVLLGAVALGLLYHRRRQLQGAVEGEFQHFREQAIGLMDQLDALRKRHRSLPATDPDFTAPMTGATLALYNAVEADLNALWDRWLEVMELWDQAKKLVRSSTGLAVRQAEEARRLLDRGHVDELLRQSASCKARLDRLNRAHEQARDGLAAGRDELAALRKSIDESAGGLSAADGGGDATLRLATMFDQAEGMIGADPIGAAEVIVRARRSVTGLVSGPALEPDRRRGPRSSDSPFDDLAAAANAFRVAAARLGVNNVLGLLARFWMVIWGLALVIGLLGPLIPLVIFVMGFVLIITGFWVIWQIVTFWFWYGTWGTRR